MESAVERVSREQGEEGERRGDRELTKHMMPKKTWIPPPAENWKIIVNSPELKSPIMGGLRKAKPQKRTWKQKWKKNLRFGKMAASFWARL